MKVFTTYIKVLISLSMFVLGHSFSFSQLQTVYPNNASFNYVGTIPGVPNHLTPNLWNRVDPRTTPDVSKTGLTNYGVPMNPEYNSSNGEPWLRCIDLPSYNGRPWVEGVYTTVSGLVPGRTYNVKFEQSIISAKIKMDGRWNVSLDNQTMSGPWMTVPTTPYSMAPWQNITLGPFVATDTTMVFKLEAEAKNQAVFGWGGCDLALDGVYLEGINTPPVANDDNLSICTGLANGTSVTTVVASDLDGDVLTYSIASGNSGGAFSINSSTGEITVANSAQVSANLPFNLIVQVDDPYGGTDNATITITSGTDIVFNTTTTDITCIANGTITVNVTAGTGPFEYSNDGGLTFQPSNVFSNLPGGTYNIVVRNAGMCPVSQNAVISTVAPFTIVSVWGTIDCLGAKSININISGGTGPFTYALNGQPWVPANLVVGTNTVTVNDGGTGCSIERDFFVADPNSVSISNISTTDVTCTTSGSITVTPGSGVAPFSYSNDGGITFQASNVFSPLTAGYYDIVVRDNNGCTASQNNVMVNAIPAFVLDSIVPLDLTCGSKGAINIYVQIGGSPVEYSIDGGGSFHSSGSFPGLDAGNYNIIVRDGNGCQTTQNVTLINTPIFVLDGTPTNVTCAGLGTITINVSAPTATMEYSIDNGLTFQDTNFFTDLAAGTYNLMVRDHNSCFNVSTVDVINIPGFVVDNVSKTDETCSTLGSISLAASGGTNPIRYSIDGGSTFSSSGDFPNLSAGSYNIVIEDANTCNHTETIVINKNTPVAINTINTTDETCAVDGTITINITGGTPPIQYSINNGISFQSSNIFTGLTSGNYTILVLDGNSCSSTQNATINSGPTPSISNITVTNVTCSSLGSINISATGGTPPYEYSIDGGTSYFSTSSFTGLSAGNYTVMIRDNNTCTQSQNATINAIAPFTVDNISSTDQTCSVLGTISINTSGGTPPIEFSLNGGSFQNSGNFNNLTAANYTITIRDGSGCSVNQNITINEILPPTLDSIAIEDDSCGACQGVLNILATGGTPPLTYSINGGLTNQANGNFPDLCSSIYSVEIRDANNCIINSNPEIKDLGTLADATITAPNNICITDGLINLTAATTGGVWNGNGINTATGEFDPILAGIGTHNISYSIIGACGDSDSVNITVVDTANPGINSVSPMCIVEEPINLTANIAGGLWSGNGITNVNSGLFDPGMAGAGTHTIYYSISGICNEIDSIDIIVSDTITPIITPVETQCTNGLPIQLNASIPGGIWSGNGITDTNMGIFDPSIAQAGISNITYSINIGACSSISSISIEVLNSQNATINPAGPFCISDDPIFITALSNGGIWSGPGINSNDGYFNPDIAGTGIHQIIYTINGTCGDSDTITIEVIPQADATINNVPILCVDGDPIQLTTNTAGGIWTGNGIDSLGIFTPLIAGNFEIIYSIPGFCGNSDQITIVVEENPIIEVSSTINNTCTGTEVELTYTSTVPLSNCTWDFGDGNTQLSCSNTTHTYEEEGCFDISLTGDSQIGCRAKKVKTDLVCIHPDPIAEFEPSKIKVKSSFPKIDFKNLSENSTIYQWDFGGEGNSTDVHPSFIFPKTTGTYNICLAASNEFGCTDVICHEVHVEDDLSISVPNSFTPNGDGLNDEFKPVFMGFGETPKYLMQIWNRWGELVFESNDTKKHWNGFVEGGSPMTNTYVWKMYLINDKGTSYELMGHVTLLR